jgi:chemotaxis protein methyltransferase CheR
MTDAEFRLFCELLRARYGLHFGPESRFTIEKRVGRRVTELDLGSFAAYHYLLRGGREAESELATLVDELTTNETYFFRELGQLRALIDEIVPELQLRPDGPERHEVRVWSAGCSSGEEPYTIVMMALEAGLLPDRDVRVYASDVSRAMLTKARRAVYRAASFRETPGALRARYFREKDGQHELSEEVVRAVDFIHLNLLDRSKIALLGSMDVILCRNVLIYLDLESKRRVIETFYEKLRPGGYLLLGHAESLISLSSAFELCHLRHGLVYRRPARQTAVDPVHVAAAAAIAKSDRPGGRA